MSDIRKFFSVFWKSPKIQDAKSKPRKAKVKVTPKQGHWEYTGPQISLYEVLHRPELTHGQKILIAAARYAEDPERKDQKNWKWVDPKEGMAVHE